MILWKVTNLYRAFQTLTNVNKIDRIVNGAHCQLHCEQCTNNISDFSSLLQWINAFPMRFLTLNVIKLAAQHRDLLIYPFSSIGHRWQTSLWHKQSRAYKNNTNPIILIVNYPRLLIFDVNDYSMQTNYVYIYYIYVLYVYVDEMHYKLCGFVQFICGYGRGWNISNRYLAQNLVLWFGRIRYEAMKCEINRKQKFEKRLFGTDRCIQTQKLISHTV